MKPITILAALSLLNSAPVGCAAGSLPETSNVLARFEARNFRESSNRVLRYRLFKPHGYDRLGTNLPLVVFLHGAAGQGEDNVRQFNGGNEVPALALTAPEAQASHPCFVMAPQCPRPDRWRGLGSRPTETTRLTLAAIESLEREFPIDPRRLYLVGVSMGGHGVWDVASRFPKVFAAAVPICGAGDPATAGKLSALPIWCFHGAVDTVVSPDYARKMIAALRKAGGQPKYTEYPGVGHDSYRRAFQEADLLPWLFAQRRRE